MADQIGEEVDYLQGWAFVMEISGIPNAGFAEAGPLKQNVALIAQEAGGARTTVDETPGKFKTEAVKCAGGASKNQDLWTWWANVKKGIKDKRICSIVAYHPDGTTPAMRYNLGLCNITEMDAGSFDAKKDENLIQSVTIKPLDIDRIPQ